MRVVSLGSGSSGNALLVEAGPGGRTRLLIDAGFPGRILAGRLAKAGDAPGRLDRPGRLSGILITHEHSDHILGLPFLMKRAATPLIADERTLAAIEQSFAGEMLRRGALAGAMLDDIEGAARGIERFSSEMPVGSRRRIGDIDVYSFAVSHDAVAPCGYLLSAGGCRVCIVIDSGVVTDTMLEAMHQADLLVLESNHDREMLLRGPYPYSLKQRILSATGHLSNDQAAEAVLRTWRSDGVRWLWLAHLSRTNNRPGLALNAMRTSIAGANANPEQVHISALPPGLGHVWDSTQLWQSPSMWETQP